MYKYQWESVKGKFSNIWNCNIDHNITVFLISIRKVRINLNLVMDMRVS